MNRKHAYCKIAISPLRAAASDASEQVSQLLFGEIVELIEVQDNWIQIRTFTDNYLGWTDIKHLVFLREKELTRWLDGLTIEPALQRIVEGPEGPMRIVRGSFRPSTNESTFQIAGHEYRWLDQDYKAELNVFELAKDYLNTPYLWGGKSPFGIDCSGFMQIIHRLVGVNLPRDAKDQFEHGMEVEWQDRQAGDLVYFINASEKIHHVGLLISENEIIHASGYVRVDDFTSDGIVRKIDGYLSHKLHGIKRI